MGVEFQPPRFSGYRVLTGGEMAAADRVAIDELNVPGIALMEQAGLRTAEAANNHYPHGSVSVVCGGGNNGGDGFCAARILKGWGRDVSVWLVVPTSRLTGDALLQFNACRGAGVTLHEHGTWAAEAIGKSQGLGLIIDACLGTGLTGAVRDAMVKVIDAINRSEAPTLSVDIPSGVCADTGKILGRAVRAERTITFQSSKLGHWLYPGAEQAGTLVVADIGMPACALSGLTYRTLLTEADLDVAFTVRSPNSHKGNYGHTAIIGGRIGASGAVMMAADGAMAAGAGLVTVGTQPCVLEPVTRDSYEVMVRPLLDVKKSPDEMTRTLKEYDSLVVGPGFPLGAEGRRMLRLIVDGAHCPGVIDADGLNHLVGELDCLHEGHWVLTPHPGEAGRLLGSSAGEVQQDRFGAVRALVEASKSVVVLKGAHTIVGTPSGVYGICPAGNPGMATAGMGDVLAGIIGALLGRGIELGCAARAGVLWHAWSGDYAARVGGVHSLRARDVIACLKEVEACWTN